MRLWSYQLITKLPRQQLLGQHRECCALRGNGWGKKQSTVDYVFNYPYEVLFAYHQLVMSEMHKRGYSVTSEWKEGEYRGKNKERLIAINKAYLNLTYKEHDYIYYQECVENLLGKGIAVDMYI